MRTLAECQTFLLTIIYSMGRKRRDTSARQLEAVEVCYAG